MSVVGAKTALDLRECQCVASQSRIVLHEGHCCFREWREDDAATYCHQEQIVALHPEALPIPALDEASGETCECVSCNERRWGF